MGPICCPETSVSNILRRVNFQKNADFIHIAAEAWNHPTVLLFECITQDVIYLNDHQTGRIKTKNHKKYYITETSTNTAKTARTLWFTARILLEHIIA